MDCYIKLIFLIFLSCNGWFITSCC